MVVHDYIKLGSNWLSLKKCRQHTPTHIHSHTHTHTPTPPHTHTQIHTYDCTHLISVLYKKYIWYICIWSINTFMHVFLELFFSKKHQNYWFMLQHIFAIFKRMYTQTFRPRDDVPVTTSPWRRHRGGPLTSRGHAPRYKIIITRKCISCRKSVL